MSIKPRVCVVIPNWNGKDKISKCIDSLLIQHTAVDVLVVENGSSDGSLDFLRNKYKNIQIVVNSKNLGFAGGVNSGIRSVINKYDYIALLNNDAFVDKDWSKELLRSISTNPNKGIVTSKIISTNNVLDSTGDFYTTWGLPYPRGRNEKDNNQYDKYLDVFSASGGSSIYSSKMLKEIGLFDEDFFAYYEDVDISFRAQLAGWKVAYEPSAITYHHIGATSSKIPGFTTYQTIKNLPWLFWKNVPSRYIFTIGTRFYLAYSFFIIGALFRGALLPVIKGVTVSIILMPKKLLQRYKIQSSVKVQPEYIWILLMNDLPPNATKLKNIRTFCRKIMLKDN